MSRTVSGHYEVPNHTAVSVLVTSTSVLSANRGRQYALFVNDSSNIIYLRLDGVAATANTGIRLSANGGSYEMSPLQGNLTQTAITAIALTGSSNLLVTEGV